MRIKHNSPFYAIPDPSFSTFSDEGCIPILFPFLGSIHHGVDFLAQFPSEFGQWVGDVVMSAMSFFLSNMIRISQSLSSLAVPLACEPKSIAFPLAGKDSRQYMFLYIHNL